MNINEYLFFLIKKYNQIKNKPYDLPSVREENTIEDEIQERVSKAYKARKNKWFGD